LKKLIEKYQKRKYEKEMWESNPWEILFLIKKYSLIKKIKKKPIS